MHHAHTCSPGSAAAQPSIFRTATSRYTTAEQSTLEDLKCQICLGVVSSICLWPCMSACSKLAAVAQSTLEDLKCQICLSVVSWKCVGIVHRIS